MENVKRLKAPKMRSLNQEKDVKEKKNKPYEYDARPTLSFTEKELPEIKDWKVGDKYKVVLVLDMNGTRIEDYGDNKGKTVASFKIDSVGYAPEEAK